MTENEVTKRQAPIQDQPVYRMTPEQVASARDLFLRKMADGRGLVMPMYGLFFSGPQFCCPTCSGFVPSRMLDQLEPPVTGYSEIDELNFASVPRMHEVVLAAKDDSRMDRFVGVVLQPELPLEGLTALRPGAWAAAAVLVQRATDLGQQGLAEKIRSRSPNDIVICVDRSGTYEIYEGLHVGAQVLLKVR